MSGVGLFSANSFQSPPGVGSGPSARAMFSKGYNPSTSEFYVFGGTDQNGPLNDFFKIQVEPMSSSSVGPKSTHSSSSTTPSMSSSVIVTSSAAPSVSSSSNLVSSSTNSVVSSSSRASSSSLVTPTTTETSQASQVITQAESTSASTGKRSIIFPSLIVNSASTSATNVNIDTPTSSSLQLNDYLIIAGSVGGILILLCLIFFCWRIKRARGSILWSSTTNEATQSTKKVTLESPLDLPQVVIDNPTTMSSNHTSHTSTGNSQSQSTQMSSTTDSVMQTFVPDELGLSFPGYLQIDFARDLRQKQMLGEGGFGIAYIADAFSQALNIYGPLVVVKQIKKPVLSDREQQSFRQEVSLMEYFKNEKNIVRLLGYSDKPFCMVLKFYMLGSLNNWIHHADRRQKIMVIAFAHDITCGIYALHQKGVIHNDLKPDNVLIDLDTEKKPFCVLSDFGISQVVRDDILRVKSFQVSQIKALSMAFAAPERIQYFRNKVSTYDRETVFSWDIYSFAILAFEMITAKYDLFE